MNNRENVFSAVAVAALFLTMVWENAPAMMIVSLLGVIAGLFLFRSRRINPRLMFIAVGLGAAAALAIVMFLKSRGH